MELLLMRDDDIYVKTDAGREEIKSRSLGLSMSTRAILLMVDGQRTVADMRDIIAGSKAPADVLDNLIAQGMIEASAAPAAARAAAPRPAAPPVVAPAAPRPVYVVDGPLDLNLATIHGHSGQPAEAAPAAVPPDRYEHLYAMMNEIVRDFLTPTKRYFFQLKIERATTPEALLELLHDLQGALAKTRGEAVASDIIARLRNAAD